MDHLIPRITQKNKIEKIYELKLSETETAELNRSAAAVQELVDVLKQKAS